MYTSSSKGFHFSNDYGTILQYNVRVNLSLKWDPPRAVRAKNKPQQLTCFNLYTTKTSFDPLCAIKMRDIAGGGICPREKPPRATLRPLGRRHLEEMGPQRNRSAKKQVRKETIFVVVDVSRRGSLSKQGYPTLNAPMSCHDDDGEDGGDMEQIKTSAGEI